MSQGSQINEKNRSAPGRAVYSSFEQKAIDLLVVEGDRRVADLLTSHMKVSMLAKFDVTLVGSLQEGLDRLATCPCEVILLDLFLPDSAGLDTLKRIRQENPEIPVVVLTDMENFEHASAAIEQGAQDYLVKGVDKAMDRSLVYALERHRTQKQLHESRQTLREAQLRLIQADKLESIGRMAAGVAHEVKNPLAILRMGVEYLRAVLDESTYASLQDICRDMDDAVTRAQTIINGMLDFSIPTDLDIQKENLPKIVHEATRMVRHEISKRNIELVVDFAERIPDIHMDRRKIQQVLVNLLTNSAHAIGENGKIEIQIESKVLNKIGDGVGRRASDPFQLGQTLVTIRIIDDGEGIPEERLEKLFDPFFTSKPVGGGTGLGLSVCKNIIELHSGKINIANRKNGGAVVTIMLPA